jgi:hypothetical protein
VSRVFTSVVIAVVCVAMFVVPSAYLITHHHSRWLALAVGLLAFPIAPAVWHGIGELRRRRAAPAKSTLTAWDRAILRGAVIAVIAIGGSLLLARGGTWKVIKHGLWFTDWSEPDPIAQSRLLDHVPANADTLIWIRPGHHTHELLPMALSGDVEMVIAQNKTDTFIAVAGEEVVLEEIVAVSKRRPDGDKLETVDAPAGMRILATPGFHSTTGRAKDLVGLLYRAPSTANAIAVGRAPSLVTRYQVRDYIAWAIVGGSSVKFTAEADTVVDLAGMKPLVERLRKLAATAAQSADCGNKAFQKATDTDLYSYGLRVRGTATLALDVVREIPACMGSLGF